MKKAYLWGIIVGIISGVCATFIEAFVALNRSLYVLWPWIGIYFYTPGLITTYIVILVFTKWLQKRGFLEPNYGLITGLASMLTFFVFDNLIVFPFFIAPVVWPWQDFFFNFRFPVGLSDTLANGIMIFFMGCWIEKKLFPSLEDSVKSYVLEILKDSSIAFLLLTILAIPSWIFAVYAFQVFVSGTSFFKTYVLYSLLIGAPILEVLWYIEYLQIRKVLRGTSVTKVFKKFIRLLVVIAIVNGSAFYFTQLFLYPFGESVLNNLLPTISPIAKIAVVTYSTIVTYQIVLLFVLLSMLVLLRENTES